MDLNQAIDKALKDSKYENIDAYGGRAEHFRAGFFAGVEWAEKYGDNSIIRIFSDEDSYKEVDK